LVALTFGYHGNPAVPTWILCGACIVTNFYVSVLLVRKNDSIVGGLPRATSSFAAAFVFLALAYFLIAASPADGSRVFYLFLGILFVLVGQALLLFATNQVYSAIVGEGLPSS